MHDAERSTFLNSPPSLSDPHLWEPPSPPLFSPIIALVCFFLEERNLFKFCSISLYTFSWHYNFLWNRDSQLAVHPFQRQVLLVVGSDGGWGGGTKKFMFRLISTWPHPHPIHNFWPLPKICVFSVESCSEKITFKCILFSHVYCWYECWLCRFTSKSASMTV